LTAKPDEKSKTIHENFFNVEIRKSGRGHIVVVTDDFGNPIRYPIRLSNFKEGPKFYVGLQTGSERQENKLVLDKFQIAQWVRDLNRLVEKSRFTEEKRRLNLKIRRKGKQKRL